MKVWCFRCFICTDLLDQPNTSDGLQKIIICSFIWFLSLQLNESLQSEIKQKLSSVQKITCITAILIRKWYWILCIWGIMVPLSRMLFKLNSFFILALFYPGIPNRREKKLTRNYKLFFKDVIKLLSSLWRISYIRKSICNSHLMKNSSYHLRLRVLIFYLNQSDLRKDKIVLTRSYFSVCQILLDLI